MNKNFVFVYQNAQFPTFPGIMCPNVYTRNLMQSMSVESGYSELVNTYTNGKCQVYFLVDEIERVQNEYTEVICHESICERAEKNFVAATEELALLTDRQATAQHIQAMDNFALADLLEHITHYYQEAIYWVEPTMFALEMGDFAGVRKKFTAWMDSAHPEITLSDRQRYFATLCLPTKKSFLQASEEELGRIALMSKEKQPAAISAYLDSYYWLKYDYYGPILEEDDVHNELAHYGAFSHEESERRVQEITNLSIRQQEILGNTLATLKLPDNLQIAFHNIRGFAYLYGDKKKATLSRINVGIGLVLAEIGRRFGLSEAALHYAALDEVTRLLRGELKITNRELEERKRSSIWLTTGGNSRLLHGDEAKMYRSYILADESALGQIHGQCGCQGVYEGVVDVIIDEKDMPTFTPGHILVTTMTTINFVQLMKQAGAIITDLGGITSHAAIVSRELGVPCVIGTKNATKQLKSGMRIRVRAHHGIVDIIS